MAQALAVNPTRLTRMTCKTRSAEKYWDDANVGDECVSPTYTVTEARIIAYADLTGDHTPVHVDEAYAQHHATSAPASRMACSACRSPTA